MASPAAATKELPELPSTPAKLGKGEVWAVRTATIVVFALLWEVAARRTDSILMPTFTEAMAALWEITVVTGELWPAMATSNVALVLGYPVAVVLAVPLGLAMARWKPVDRAFGPIVALSLALPIAPLIPGVLVAMGLGLSPRVFIIVLFSWVFIATNVRAGVRAVDQSLAEMAGSFGATESQLWRRVLIPAALPAIMTGLRTGLGRAFAGMVIVELIMLPIGIGATCSTTGASSSPTSSTRSPSQWLSRASCWPSSCRRWSAAPSAGSKPATSTPQGPSS